MRDQQVARAEPPALAPAQVLAVLRALAAEEDRRVAARDHGADAPRVGAEGRRALGRLEHAEPAAGAGAEEDDVGPPPPARRANRRAARAIAARRAPCARRARAGPRRAAATTTRSVGSASSRALRGLRCSVASRAQRPAAGRSQAARVEGEGQQLAQAQRSASGPSRVAMWTAMSPQYSHRICRQAPHGGVGRFEPRDDRDRVEVRRGPRRPPSRRATRSAHIGQAVRGVLDVAAGDDLAGRVS